MDRNPHRFARLLAGTCAAAIAVAGCSGGGDGDRSAQPPATVGPSGSDPGATAPPPNAQEDPVSPLEEFLGFRVAHRPEGLGTNAPELNPDSPGPSDEDRRDQLRLEQMIGECMRAEGFDYVVRDSLAALADPGQSPYALAKDQFAGRYGYGISTIDIPSSTEVDPNYAAMARMTPVQREAYLLALDGRAEQGDAEHTGCRGAAVKAVFGRSVVGSAGDGLGGEFASLVEKIDRVGQRVDDDPRVAGDAGRQWSDCMADAGHPGFTRPSDAPASVTARLAQARGGDPSTLAEVRRYELALSGADSVCRPAYDAARRVVRDELERAFLDEHRPELERYRRAMNP